MDTPIVGNRLRSRPDRRSGVRVTETAPKPPSVDPTVDPVMSRFFKLSPDLFCVAGQDGFFRHLNPAWEVLLGLPLAELYARPLLEFVHPDDRPGTLAAMRRLAAGERVTSFENRYRRGDGLYARLLWSAAPAPEGLVYALARDVTAQREAEAQGAAAHRFSDALINSLPAVFYMFTQGGRFVRWNRNFERVTGYTALEIGEMHPLAFFGAGERERIAAAIQEAFSAGTVVVEAELLGKDGRGTPHLFTGERVTLAGAHYLVGSGFDVSERNAARAALDRSERRANAILEGIANAFYSLDRDWHFTYINRQAERILQRPRERLLGQNVWEVFTWAVGTESYRRFHEAVEAQEPAVFEAFSERLGTWFEIHAHPSPEGLSVYFTDVSERKHAEALIIESNALLERRVGERTAELLGAKAELERVNERLQHDALHDALTGLPNRAFLCGRLERALAEGADFALLYLDLDRFKVVNDSLGHDAGDALLVTVGERLRASLRPGDLAARLGGDEFVLLLTDVGLAEAEEVAQRLQRELRRPFPVAGHEFYTTASVGIVVGGAAPDLVHASPPYGSPAEVLQDADLAMYRAKAQGKACYAVFDRALRDRAVAVQALEADLRGALRRGELGVHYQPIVEARSGRLVGFEALVRWEHPQFGAVSPGEFIPLAEETGLVIELDRWVLETACAQVAVWGERYGDLLSVSVNLSSQQFGRADLTGAVAAALSGSGLEPARLKLELTEGVMLATTPAVARSLAGLRELGVGLAIDDFGTGYSSLAYLQRLSADQLKIDRAFIDKLGTAGGTELVRTVVAVAHALGMQVVAEGVETAQQLAELRELACEFVQGYFLSKPLNVAEVGALLERGAA